MSGINLHNVVRGAITTVYPDDAVVVLTPAGYTVGADYAQTPTYAPAIRVLAQSQPVNERAVTLLRQTRENTIWRDFYIYGPPPGFSRADGWGGALLYWAGYEWLVDQVLEDYASGGGVDWSKLRAVRQRRVEPPELGTSSPPPLDDIPGPYQGGNV